MFTSGIPSLKEPDKTGFDESTPCKSSLSARGSKPLKN